jgi:hypothetical protein
MSEIISKELVTINYIHLKFKAQYLIAIHDYLERNWLFGTYKEAQAHDHFKTQIELIMIEDYKRLVEENMAEPHNEPVQGFKNFVDKLTEDDKKEVAEAKQALREVASTNERTTD